MADKWHMQDSNPGLLTQSSRVSLHLCHDTIHATERLRQEGRSKSLSEGICSSDQCGKQNPYGCFTHPPCWVGPRAKSSSFAAGAVGVGGIIVQYAP